MIHNQFSWRPSASLASCSSCIICCYNRSARKVKGSRGVLLCGQMVKNYFERRSSGQVVKMTVNFFDPGLSCDYVVHWSDHLLCRCSLRRAKAMGRITKGGLGRGSENKKQKSILRTLKKRSALRRRLLAKEVRCSL